MVDQLPLSFARKIEDLGKEVRSETWADFFLTQTVDVDVDMTCFGLIFFSQNSQKQ